MSPFLSRDSLDYERRGRVVAQDHHREALRTRARELLRVPDRSSGAASQWSSSLSGGTSAAGNRPRSNETVFKVISWTKAQRAPLTQAKYASRTRDQDDPGLSLPMINEEGRALHGAEIAAEVGSWELVADFQNLSPAAKAATAEDRAAMTQSERLQR